MSPTNAIGPHQATQAATASDPAPSTSRRILGTLTPRDSASSSPKANVCRGRARAKSTSQHGITSGASTRTPS